MRGRSASPLNVSTIPVAILAAVLAWGCSAEHAENRHSGVTATGNTGRIGGRVDSAGIGGAARTLASQVPVKVFLLQVVVGGDSLRDSTTTFRGGAYLFEELPDAMFKVFAVSDADGWASDTLRAEIRGGSHVDLPIRVRMPDTLNVRKGMTWGKRKRDDKFGIDFVSCNAPMDGVTQSCSTTGDHPCSAVLHLLCLKPQGSTRPAYQVDYPANGGMPLAYYGGWTGGSIRLGRRVEGRQLLSQGAADSLCSVDFGTGWRMAEFHDGQYIEGMDSTSYHDATWSASLASSGGWGFYGTSDNLPMDIRFWVRISDQAANCWDP